MAESKGKIGSLFYGMSLDTKEFKKKLKSARKTLTEQGKAMRESFKAIGKGFTIAAAAITTAGAGMLLFAKNTLAATKAQVLLAESIGVTQKEIAGLELLTEKFGVETNMVIDKMREFGGLDEFKKLAEQVKTAGDEQAQLNKAVELFGGEGAKMLPVLQQGAAGFAAMEEEALQLGLALSPEQIAASKVAWEELESTLFSIKGLGKQIGAAFLKPLGTIAAGVSGFIAAFKDDMLGGVQLAADLMTDFIMGAFNLFNRFGIPFINGFISFANQIGEAFENLFAFLSPATNSAFSGLTELFDTVIAFIATFKQSMIIGISRPIEAIIDFFFSAVNGIQEFVHQQVLTMAALLEGAGIEDEGFTESLSDEFLKQRLAFKKAGKDIAKPFGDAQKEAAKEMEDILTKQALKNQSQQQKFAGVISKFSIKFGDAIENAGKVAKEVTQAITGPTISDRLAGLALSGSQEEARLLAGGEAIMLDKERNRELKKFNKNLKEIGTF